MHQSMCGRIETESIDGYAGVSWTDTGAAVPKDRLESNRSGGMLLHPWYKPAIP